MAYKNRLNLDFSLTSREARTKYIHAYLDAIPFTPTPTELDTMAKYILWGENKDGLNGRQEGLELETASKTWDSKNLESLDALIESPTFNESSIRGPHNPPTKVSREVFSRASTRKSAPAYLLTVFEDLWRKIDETEFLVQQYEIDHGKRTTEIRTQLLERFSEDDLGALRAKAENLQPFQHLKLKHQLVELRREQYTIKDSYAPVLASFRSPCGRRNWPSGRRCSRDFTPDSASTSRTGTPISSFPETSPSFPSSISTGAGTTSNLSNSSI